MFKNSEVKVFLTLVCVITCADASDFYSLVDERLTIPPATLRGQSVCQPVTIFGDDILEANETFTITISLTNSIDRLLGLNTTLVTILNDDRTLIDVPSVYVSNSKAEYTKCAARSIVHKFVGYNIGTKCMSIQPVTNIFMCLNYRVYYLWRFIWGSIKLCSSLQGNHVGLLFT